MLLSGTAAPTAPRTGRGAVSETAWKEGALNFLSCTVSQTSRQRTREMEKMETADVPAARHRAQVYSHLLPKTEAATWYLHIDTVSCKSPPEQNDNIMLQLQGNTGTTPLSFSTVRYGNDSVRTDGT